MTNCVIRYTNDWLMPLYSVMKEILVSREILHTDETVLQVLKEPEKKAQYNSYIWLYRTSGYTDHAIVLYEYQLDRAAKCTKSFLEMFKGYLYIDGYAGYHNLSKDITICVYWSDAPRKFDETLKSLAFSEHIGSSALAGKNYCDKLFAIEITFDTYTIEERYVKCKELTTPILDDFLSLLKNCNALPKSALRKVVYYTLTQWKYLENYLLDGRCEISNNRTERSINPFVIGRKKIYFLTQYAEQI